jgi:hypothetical protein
MVRNWDAIVVRCLVPILFGEIGEARSLSVYYALKKAARSERKTIGKNQFSSSKTRVFLIPFFVSGDGLTLVGRSLGTFPQVHC